MAFKTPPAPPLKPPLGERDHVRGAANGIELVEYGDFECPHCNRAFVIVEQLRKDMGDQIRFGFRHFPLGKMHPHARKASEAAEAAGAQGKFWEMHDLLFQHGGELEDENLIQYAAELGLDVARFTRELGENAYAAHIQEDIASGVRSGVNGTPTFFINGSRHNGGYDYESLVAALQK